LTSNNASLTGTIRQQSLQVLVERGSIDPSQPLCSRQRGSFIDLERDCREESVLGTDATLGRFVKRLLSEGSPSVKARTVGRTESSTLCTGCMGKRDRDCHQFIRLNSQESVPSSSPSKLDDMRYVPQVYIRHAFRLRQLLSAVQSTLSYFVRHQFCSSTQLCEHVSTSRDCLVRHFSEDGKTAVTSGWTRLSRYIRCL